MLRIDYYRKDSYGNTHYYIKDRRIESYIRDLLKKPTITKHEIEIFEHLFDVKFVQVVAIDEETPI
jgi:hypothetical protein